MPVNTPHPDYSAHAPTWQAITDTLAGAQQIKRSGEAYLPRLAGMTDEDYQAYKLRTVFFNATARTADAYRGMIMRKAPVTTATGLEAFLQNVDLHGNPWNGYCEEIVAANSSLSRAGTLVDWNENERRPFLTHYVAANVLNWEVETVNGQPTLTLLVLQEWSSTVMQAGEASKDRFCQPSIPQWRVFEALSTGVICTVWRRDASQTAPAKDGEKFVIVSETIMQRRGKPLKWIPFVFHGLGQDRVTPCTPMLADMVEVQLGHYRLSADYENGLHMCGLPQPWAKLFTPPEGSKVLTIGTTRAWISDDKDAECGYMEFSGAGLEAIRHAMDDKKKDMASLGARAIQPEKADAEAFDTVKMRANAETASLNTVATASSRSLSEVLAWALWWTGADENPALNEALVTINSDFVAASIDPTMLTALMAAFQGNLISWEVFFYQMQKGEMYPAGRKIEDEEKAISANPLPPPVPPGGPEPDPAKKPAA